MIIRTAHQSGRFDATSTEQAAMLEQLVRTSSVAVVTEAGKVERPEQWSFVGGETKVLWHARHWERTTHGTIVIPTPPWKRGGAPQENVKIEWAGLADHATGLVLLRGGGHFPAHLFKPSQRKANAAALRGLASALAPIIEQTNPDEVTLSFDFNRPLTIASQAKLVEGAVSELGLHLVVPPKATHGLRTIDGFLTTSALVDGDMLRRMPGFDHVGARMRSCADCAKGSKR